MHLLDVERLRCRFFKKDLNLQKVLSSLFFSSRGFRSPRRPVNASLNVATLSLEKSKSWPIRLIFEQAVGKCWGSRTYEALRFLRYLCRFISASLSRWKCVTESTQQKLKMGEKERNGTMRLDDEYGTIDCYFWNRTEQTKPGTHPLALFLSHFPTLTHSLTLCIPKQAMRVVVMYKLNFW